LKNLLVIPSIDIKHGKTVRVVQGIPELDCEQYGNDPVDMARIWRAENAKLIHIVDFDGAHEQSKQNYKVVEEICSSVVIPVEFAGGIRNYEDSVTIMQTGISRLAINTMALENRNDFIKVFEKYGPSKICVSLDIKDDELIICGRSKRSGISYIDFTREMIEIGINRFLVCDISKNGLLEGPNIELSKHIAEETGAKVTHAGGVRNKDELLDIQKLVPLGVDSVIIGRALYENRFPCQKLWRVAELGLFN
jgi:phosphoribosylformimino-5-aminoimidazole carboxamide ribotide isomerase